MNTCSGGEQKIIAQTLFLGASVTNYNSNMGWTGQPSQLTVNLVSDEASAPCVLNGAPQAQFSSLTFPDNHYYTCAGDACYIDSRNNSTWSSSNIGTTRADGSIVKDEDRIIPGKVYYDFNSSRAGIDPVVSKYHIYGDPGFLGAPNRIDTGGNFSNRLSPNNIGYDIIGTPVYFKMGNFTFGGIVQSWQEDFNSGGKQYRVTIDGMHSILSNSFIIISEFAGSIFSKYNASSTYGSPRNFVSAGLDYTGKISEGNIANVFNVYGFLESFAPENFGGSDSNDDGISAVDIIDALSVLTSSLPSVGNNYLKDRANTAFNNFGPKTAYSSFGRILTKCAQTYDYTKISTGFSSWGVIPPQVNAEDGSERCEFLLDLSELPRPPREFRIKGVKISISEFINTVTEASGYDYSLELIPVILNNRIYNTIKLKTISRLKQPVSGQIQSTINKLYADGHPISSSTIGKERNENPARMMIVGGPQQRLYQAKSYRLAYTQSNYVFIDSAEGGRFVDYSKLGHYFITGCSDGSISKAGAANETFGFGKVKFPAFLSTRNPTLSNTINPTISALFADDENIKTSITGSAFATTDPTWNDGKQITNGGVDTNTGNYENTVEGTYTVTSNWGMNPVSRDSSVSTRTTRFGKNNKPHLQRYIPLHRDVICPFFGYIMDNSLSVDTDRQTLNNRDFRRARPVYMDSWTGQICVMFRASELPATRLELAGLYGGYNVSTRQARLWSFNNSKDATGQPVNPTPTTITKEWFFLITESEIRAAMMGGDSFLAYSCGRKYKTDLYVMINEAYFSKRYTELTNSGSDPATAAVIAKKDADFSWNFGSTSIANYELGATTNVPGRPDGVGIITEPVRQDFQVLQGFIAKLGENYYGKKYMVHAPFLGARKDESYDSSFNTTLGAAYVFRGGSQISYNYTPTNDGAWEEYGNTIDDTIIVGTKDSYNLSDERGLIKPIIGYNASDTFDMPRYNICRQPLTQVQIQQKVNPYFSYSEWENAKLTKTTNCDPSNFIFPSINMGSLSDPSSYILKTLTVGSTDGFGINRGFPRKKLYTKSAVQEKIIFLDPEQLSEPRIIVESQTPIELNLSSLQYQKDPNRTVKATINMEDLAVYLRVNPSNKWDCQIIRSLLHGIQNVYSQYPGFLFGNMSNSSHDTNGQNMDLKPKIAHPFFVGIPIKSNQFNYGPWINYPSLDITRDNIFPSSTIYQKDGSSSTVSVSEATAKTAIDNWILPTQIEYNPEYVPWNYGGMSFLDQIACKEVKTNINYQSILETASLEMGGLPLFNLGGAFNSQALNDTFPISSATYVSYIYKEIKRTNNVYSNSSTKNRSLSEFSELSSANYLTYTNGTLTYNVIKLPYNANYLSGPIISNISVEMGRGGLKTSYSFRTYTRKLSLFNKEYSDRFKKIFKDNLQRDKQIAKLKQQLDNKSTNELRTLSSQARVAQTTAGALVGKSPVEVITAAASPFLKEPTRSTPYIADQDSLVTPTESDNGTYSLHSSSDVGAGDIAEGAFDSTFQLASLKHRSRLRTTAQIFQLTELNDYINQDYGSKAAMSLDGIFSPVSFYPTNNLGTFSFSKYDSTTCPVCNGTRIRVMDYQKYQTASVTAATGEYKIVCDCCSITSDKLSSKLYSGSTDKSKGSSETLPPYILTDKTDASALSNMSSLGLSSSSDGNSIPINLVSLQPIVVPYSEFKNPNTQNYSGEHPNKSHPALKINGNDRNFIDRSRHSISIVARSAVRQPALHLTAKIDNNGELINGYNPDFYHKDLIGNRNIKSIDSTNYSNANAETNQRFIGFRGPLVVHGWGYDKEGYPVPNAADEPVDIDDYGRPKRFVLSRTETPNVEYKALSTGDIFILNSKEYVKATSLALQQTEGNYPGPPFFITDSTTVTKVTYKDDLSLDGGFDPETHKGSIIGKTQVFSNNYWTQKTKLNEFYLNWAEHPEIWPVGPVDLRWDESRRIWVAGSQTTYKMVYITLEEDLVKPEGLDETYPARGFLDDLEYSTKPLDGGYRRIVFVKDRAGYTAPRGAKLLCRYDTDSGFYEPISKPSFVVMGIITSGGGATVTMSYVNGIKKGESAPTMEVSFDNPLDFSIPSDISPKGLFTYTSGKWILTAISS
jgi:hypothetical protein